MVFDKYGFYNPILSAWSLAKLVKQSTKEIILEDYLAFCVNAAEAIEAETIQWRQNRYGVSKFEVSGAAVQKQELIQFKTCLRWLGPFLSSLFPLRTAVTVKVIKHSEKYTCTVVGGGSNDTHTLSKY